MCYDLIAINLPGDMPFDLLYSEVCGFEFHFWINRIINKCHPSKHFGVSSIFDIKRCLIALKLVNIKLPCNKLQISTVNGIILRQMWFLAIVRSIGAL